jgi:ankyrin repeat protein
MNELCRAAFEGDLEDVARILSVSTKNINTLSASGSGYSWSPLQFSAEQGKISIVKYIVNHGANVAVVDSDGWGILKVAANNIRGVVQYLLTVPHATDDLDHKEVIKKIFSDDPFDNWDRI